MQSILHSRMYHVRAFVSANHSLLTSLEWGFFAAADCLNITARSYVTPITSGYCIHVSESHLKSSFTLTKAGGFGHKFLFLER